MGIGTEGKADEAKAMPAGGARLAKTYEPKAVEAKQYRRWMEGGYFKAAVDKTKKPFSIVIPPPNITGRLHLGHALDNTCQDILIRWRRMQGYEALWMPGTDHASIATEAKLVEALAKEGTSKEKIGRGKFLERAWAWKGAYAAQIVEQLKQMGCSCDWERERFTLDEGLSDAVLEVFVRLYDEGLIYRGERIVNWCPRCATTISDIEVEYQERDGQLWHIRYPLLGPGEPREGALSEGAAAGLDEPQYVTVATTRPETMLGDTAVAVNPDDPRYRGIVGRRALLPLLGREIPVITDSYVDMSFGTGAVKITPAHDPNDFEVGLRHGLEQICVMDEQAVMNANAGPYAGLGRYEARARIVKDLEAQGLIEKAEPHRRNVGECSRCHETVEPLISRQWFVSMKPLAGPAIEAVKSGQTRFVPDRFAKIYYNWMENIQDWCISRQLWWGHRIPAFYCDACGETVVSKAAPQACPKCGAASLRQDEDTLDTWFSSALWPFSTMGWPQRTPELDYFYPTSVLVTSYDIIFFWVARMIFSGLKHTGQAPFRHVFIHGLIRDEQGRKMSKTLGNGVDPLDVIDQYGADAMRFALVIGNAAGNDLRFSRDKQEQARNFANKIWNAARFVLMHADAAAEQGCGDDAGYGVCDGTIVPDAGPPEEQLLSMPLSAADRWILSGYNRLVREATENLEKFEMGIALQKIYEFIWDSYCDWYIEFAKPSLATSHASGAKGGAKVDGCPCGNGGGNATSASTVKASDSAQAAYAERRAVTLRVLRYVLSGCMKLLHPFMPFITDEIYTALAGGDAAAAAAANGSVMVSEWPCHCAALEAEAEERQMRFLMDVIRGIRNLRSERDVPPSRKLTARFTTEDVDKADALMSGSMHLERLAGIASYDVQINLMGAASAPGSLSICSDGSYNASSVADVAIAEAATHATFVVDGAQAFIPLGELLDIVGETERLEKERQRLEKEIARAAGRLASEGFVSKAPPTVVSEERRRLKKYTEMLEKVHTEHEKLHMIFKGG